MEKSTCFSHTKTRLCFCEQHMNHHTQQYILHAAMSHGVNCSVTTYAEDAAYVQGWTNEWISEQGCHMQGLRLPKNRAIADDVLPQSNHCLTWDIAEQNDSCIAARTTLSAEREQDVEPDGQ
jgi:hypothetical protein